MKKKISTINSFYQQRTLFVVPVDGVIHCILLYYVVSYSVSFNLFVKIRDKVYRLFILLHNLLNISST
jgi:hypothetical protein